MRETRGFSSKARECAWQHCCSGERYDWQTSDPRHRADAVGLSRVCGAGTSALAKRGRRTKLRRRSEFGPEWRRPERRGPEFRRSGRAALGVRAPLAAILASARGGSAAGTGERIRAAAGRTFGSCDLAAAAAECVLTSAGTGLRPRRGPSRAAQRVLASAAFGASAGRLLRRDLEISYFAARPRQSQSANGTVRRARVAAAATDITISRGSHRTAWSRREVRRT